MVNAQRTGAYISSLRKAKDWTQLDLAQRLLVTHQAVSQWEKGASLPDITLLPPLAKLFDVTVDELLNGGEPPAQNGARLSRWAIMEGLPPGKPAEASPQPTTPTRTEKENINPMLDKAPTPTSPPSEPEAPVTSLAGYNFTMKQLIELAPFVSKEFLDTLLADAKVQNVEGDTLLELAPFLSKETLGRWMARLEQDSLNRDHILELAPFVGKESLAAMVGRLMDRGEPTDWELVHGLAPFVGHEILAVLLQRMPEGPVLMEHVVELAPFIKASELDRLLAQVTDPTTRNEYLEELAPFLSKDTLKRMFEERRANLDTEGLVKLAPFLGREALEQILRKPTQQ